MKAIDRQVEFAKVPSTERGKFPARLHVLIARDAKTALVIRRGPSMSVCTVLWNRKTDKFTPGQWLRGRIYERRCDLSPDGKHFIYFAMNGRWESETKGSWTAISRVPYLKAIVLLAKGDCWNGGGLFKSNREYWLNDGYVSKHVEMKGSGHLRQNPDSGPAVYYGGECLTGYYHRLQRDGWVMQKYEGYMPFEKRLPKGWHLRKLAFADSDAPAGRGCYWDAHELRQDSTGTVLAFPEWEWSDFIDGRLVWAVEGQLRTARLGRGKLIGEKLLHDFNGMKFSAIAAPY